MLLRNTLGLGGGFRLRGSHPLCRSFPSPSAILPNPTAGSYNPGDKSPVWALPLSLATTDGIDSLSFPPVTEMFHFTGYRVPFPIFVRERTMAYWRHQVTPFGNLRIKAHLRLPEAYRSLARPSSPVSTKASTVCPSKLDSNLEISHAARGSLAKTLRHALQVGFDLPTARHSRAGLCRKNYICIWDSNISPRPRKNGSFELHYLLQSEKIFLHVDVKERTHACLSQERLRAGVSPVCAAFVRFPARGRPDRT